MRAAVWRLVVGSTLFAIYAPWISSEVGWEDSAFFQLCHATLGVPHGPGFPLYVLLGRLLAWPVTPPALGSNLLSALAFALAGVVLFEIVLLLFRDHASRVPSTWGMLAALAVVIGWAALPVHMPQATRTEVYTLVLLLVLCVCYAALRAQEEGSRSSWVFACLAAWCWGLAMAVHPLIAFAAGTPWLLFASRAWRTRWFTLAVFALAPMSLYLYPPLRGRIEGVWAWGDFSSLPAMLDYFTRRSAWDAATVVDGGWRENLAGWWSACPRLFPMLLWIPALGGFWLMRKIWPFLLSFVAIVLLVLWAAPYDPANLDLLGYFLPALAMLAAGLAFCCVRGASRLWLAWPALSARTRLLAGIGFASLAVVWPAASLVTVAQEGSAGAGAGRLTQNLEATLPEGATLFVSEDNFLGVLEYARVLGFRPDVQVISLGALRHPHYRRMIAARIDKRLSSGWQFEHTWSEALWRQELERIFAAQTSDDPWFVQFDRFPGVKAAHLQPRGFVAALAPSSEGAWQTGLAFWKEQAGRVADGPAREALARWIFNFGALALEDGEAATGWEAMHLALDVSPEEPEMYYLLGQALERAGRITDSRVLLSVAVEMAPYRERYRRALEALSPALAVQP